MASIYLTFSLCRNSAKKPQKSRANGDRWTRRVKFGWTIQGNDFHSLVPRRTIAMLSTAQSAAIHCTLVLGLPEPEAAKSAGISASQAKEAFGCFDEVIPGRKVNFNRLFAKNDPLASDRRLLRYEIQLGRLEYQHDECIQSWRRTKEHADKLHERLPDAVDEDGNPRKPYVGDIRFLQLAKNIRREMEKIEEAIAERIEHLEKVHSLGKTAVAPPKRELTTPTEPANPLGVITSHSATSATTTPSQSPPQGRTLPSELLRMLGSKFTPAPNSPPPPRKEIPTIEPPPRKKDKYADVNR
jgi:hypothetical protein